MRRLPGGAVLGLCLLAGCTKGAGGPDGGGAFTTVSALPLDGYLLLKLQSPDPMLSDGVLFDPRTGKSSANVIPLLSASDYFGVSPRGDAVAYWSGTAGQLMVSAVAGGDTPTWGPAKSLAVPNTPFQFGEPINFNSLGDRISVSWVWWDPATDRSLKCSTPGGATQLVSPDGRHHVMSCSGEGSVLYDDFAVAMVLDGAPRAFSADGQWLDLGGRNVHVPSLTQVLALAPKGPGPRGTTARGDFISLTAGVRGTIVSKGTTAVVSDPLAPVLLTDPWSDPTAASAPDAGTFPLGDPAPFDQPDGTRWDLAGVSPDARYAFVQLLTHQVGEGLEGLEEQPTGWRLRRLSRDGAVVDIPMRDGQDGPELDFVTPCLAAPSFQRERFAQRPVGFLFVNGDLALCPSGSDPTGRSWQGVHADQPLWSTNLGILPSLDGQLLVGATFPKTQKLLCVRPSVGGQASCMAVERDGAVPVAMVGHGAAGVGRSSTAPTPVWLSQTAAFPGQEVVLFGFNFGAAGTLRIGDFAVPAADLVSWADTELHFKASAAMPTEGLVTVDTGTGRSSRQLQLVLHRTSRWVSPGDSVPTQSTTLRQGINSISFPGVNGFFISEASFNPVAPGTGLLKLPASSADRVELYLPGTDPTHRWLSFFTSTARVVRPLEETPGFDPSYEWNLAGDLTGIDPPTGFDFEQLKSELVCRRAGFLVRKPATGADWSLPALCTNRLGCPAPLPLLPSVDALATSGSSDAWYVENSPAVLHKVKGFTYSGGYALHAAEAAPATDLGEYFATVGAHGPNVIALLNTGGSASAKTRYRISTDSGATFAPALEVPAWVAAPRAVGGAMAGFYGYATSAVARIDFAGMATLAFAPMPPTVGPSARIDAELGDTLIAFDRSTKKLYQLDPAQGTPAWAELTAGGSSGKVLGFSTDSARARLLVARDDGELIAVSTAGAVTTLPRPKLGTFSGALVLQAGGALANGELVVVGLEPVSQARFLMVRP